MYNSTKWQISSSICNVLTQDTEDILIECFVLNDQ